MRIAVENIEVSLTGDVGALIGGAEAVLKMQNPDYGASIDWKTGEVTFSGGLDEEGLFAQMMQIEQSGGYDLLVQEGLISSENEWADLINCIVFSP